MATQAEIEYIANALRQIRPAPMLQKINETQAGIGAVLRYLTETEGTVTAGGIAEFMGVSTARVAVLLKKMTARGLIVKDRDPRDARVTIVRLSDQGYRAAQDMKSSMYRKVGEVIDRVGMERMREFVAVAGEIAQVFPKPEDALPPFLEE